MGPEDEHSEQSLVSHSKSKISKVKLVHGFIRPRRSLSNSANPYRLRQAIHTPVWRAHPQTHFQFHRNVPGHTGNQRYHHPAVGGRAEPQGI